MNIQIFGTKKSKDTQKAIRFFKERRIPFQHIDLSQKGVSKGELNSIMQSVPLENLIDKDSKEYQKQNLEYIVHDVEEKLLENALLFKMPIVRNGKKATIGLEEKVWKEWIDADA